MEPGSTIAVYDFGGGTFDAAVVHKDPHGFSLLGRPEGVERLGGIDLDELVFEHVVEGLPEAFDGLDESDPAVLSAVAAVRRECTEAKEALSADTEVSIPVLTPVGQGSVRLHRSEFEAMIRPPVEDTVSALRRAIASAGVSADQLTAVLLVGGSSRIPLVAQMVSEQLGRPVAVDADPKNAIAKGAALSLTPAGISATGTYPPAPRGHGSGPMPVALHGAAASPAATGAQLPWAGSPQQTEAYAPAAQTSADDAFAPTQRLSSPRLGHRPPGRRCRSTSPRRPSTPTPPRRRDGGTPPRSSAQAEPRRPWPSSPWCSCGRGPRCRRRALTPSPPAPPPPSPPPPRPHRPPPRRSSFRGRRWSTPPPGCCRRWSGPR